MLRQCASAKNSMPKASETRSGSGRRRGGRPLAAPRSGCARPLGLSGGLYKARSKVRQGGASSLRSYSQARRRPSVDWDAEEQRGRP
mmetsp:Transcript_68051/g.193055  ORF Transcript_68051/g.193055 Transcript_68051/m.193055 type:complete len:87 (-) Transcript_68051:266-526(-)